MEEEVDLREYIEVIVRRWKWIAGITLVAVVTAAIVSFLLNNLITPVYEASATLFTSPLIPASLSLEAQVVEALGKALSPSERESGGLVAEIKVAQEGESRVFKVSARAGDPQRAAQIANAWAEVGAEVLREAQTPTDGELKIAEQNLKAAEEALWEFAEANGLAEADLRSLLGSRREQWSINFLLGEGGVISQRTSPSLSVEKRMELASLLRRRDIAEEIYLSLSKEAEIAKITAQAGGGAEVVSPAVAPSEPVQPRTKLNIAIAGVLGLMAGVFGAFVAEYFEGWERGKEGN